MLNKLLGFAVILMLASCSHKAQNESGVSVWHLTSKAQITDKTKDSSHNVSIDIFVKEETALRMEVTALLGYQVGSLLMTGNQIKYAVHPNKYFIQGPLLPKALKPLFKQEVDPRLLWSVVHDQSLARRGFQCVQKEPSVELCKNNLAVVEIEQRGELDASGKSKDHQKKVTIENSQIKMVWIFKSKEPFEGSQSETFVLNSPKEYKLLTIK